MLFLNLKHYVCTLSPLLDLTAKGHTIGSHSSSHKNLQYGNDTILEQEIVHAHDRFKEYLGYELKIFRPPFGGIDHRSHKLLEELGYTIVMWSAGCNDWWFTDNKKDLETSIAALRYTLAEAGGIICMHDKAEEPNKGERLRKLLDDTWNFW
jgi:peptidoglycan/xylan/chitin deacetylase (PgdA/CDA1 family)